MKTVFSILLALSINAFGQTTVYYLNSAPNLVMSPPINTGTSSYIGLDYTINTSDSFLVYIISTSLTDNGYDTCHNRVIIGIHKVSEIITWPMYQYNINNWNAYKLNFNIPIVPSGNYRLKTRGYNNCAFNYSCPNCTSPQVFTINNINAIEQQIIAPKELLSTEYYNLLGQPIKEPNGITVEVKTYTDKSKEVRKIITY